MSEAQMKKTSAREVGLGIVSIKMVGRGKVFLTAIFPKRLVV